MAKFTNGSIDIDAQTWAQLMAVSAGGGTLADFFEESKEDQRVAVTAALAKYRVGATFGNNLGVILEELWTKARTPTTTTEVVWEQDWSALSDSGALSDGSVSVGSKTFTLVNAAKCSTKQITNGAGLQFVHSAGTTTDLDNGLATGSTGTYLHCALNTLAAECAKYSSRIRLWAYFSAYDLPQTSNQAVFGIATEVGSYTQSTYAAQLQNVSTDGPGLKWGSTEVVGAEATTADNVIVFDSIFDGIFHVYYGQWDGGWPEFDTLKLAGRNVVPGVTSTALWRHSEAHLMIGIATNTTTGAPSFTLANTKIEIG